MARIRSLVTLPLLFALANTSCRAEDRMAYEPRNGDIVFHTSRSSQSLAIQKATRSPYSHMGIVYLEHGKPVVFEAVEPVRTTPLADWIRRGEGGHFVVKRLVCADEVLTDDVLARMLAIGRGFEGRPYDLYFEWSDDRIYCSELVWKIYQRACGLEIGARQTIEELDLSDPLVQAKVQERFGGPPPAHEPFISPAAMFDSDFLETVHRR
jgi:hypothetical protein